MNTASSAMTGARISRTGAAGRMQLIDALRGIAAVTVMFYHAENLFQIDGPFRRGYLLVDFFFVISGFVLTRAMEGGMRQEGGAARFLTIRLRRFLPMNVIALAVGAAVLWLASRSGSTGAEQRGELSLTAGNLALGLLLLPNLAASLDIFPINPVQWSLMQELLANMLHAIVLKRLGDRQVLRLAGVAGLCLAFSIYRLGENTGGPCVFNWVAGLPRGIFAYLVGVWLARRHASGRARLPDGGGWRWLVMLVAPLAVVVAVNGIPGGGGPGAIRAAGDVVVTLVVFPTLLWLAARSPVPARMGPWLGALGAISFPLYAVHLPILRLFAQWGQPREALSADVRFALAVASALMLAGLIAFVERRTALFDIVYGRARLAAKMETSAA